MPDDAQELPTAAEADPPEHSRELEQVLDRLPPELLIESLERRDGARMQASILSWQAPLPPAEMLRQYDDICPGFADRIISSSEREQAHRHSCEKSSLDASIIAEKRGQWMALGIAVVMIATSGWLISTGHSIAGSIFGGATLLGLVALFQNKGWKLGKESKPTDDDSD